MKDTCYVLFVWIYLNTYLYLMNSKIVLNSVFTFSFVWFSFFVFHFTSHLWYNSIYFTRNTYRKYPLRFQCFLIFCISFLICFSCVFVCYLVVVCLSSVVYSFFACIWSKNLTQNTFSSRTQQFSFVIGLFKNSFLIWLNLQLIWM